MGKVIIHVTMSLDGFIAGPNDEVDWGFKLWNGRDGRRDHAGDRRGRNG